jgi:hypothetical protein
MIYKINNHYHERLQHTRRKISKEISLENNLPFSLVVQGIEDILVQLQD